MRRHATATLFLAALTLAGCATQRDAVQVPLPVTQTAVAHVGSPAGADDNLNAVLWMQSSAEYDAAVLSVYHAAAARLDAALADPAWDALAPGERDNAGVLATLPPAVILDVDETVLDNSPYQARLVARGTRYEEATWAAWVGERAARPVPGVLAFARAADARGITLVFLSNRTESSRDATLDNLRAAGLPVRDDTVFLGKGTAGCESAGSAKDCRRRLVAADYRVLMQFGDQLGDFVATHAAAPAARQALVERHAAWFGERWWMLPNPTYGDWVPTAKRALLDTAGQ